MALIQRHQAKETRKRDNISCRRSALLADRQQDWKFTSWPACSFDTIAISMPCQMYNYTKTKVTTPCDISAASNMSMVLMSKVLEMVQDCEILSQLPCKEVLNRELHNVSAEVTSNDATPEARSHQVLQVFRLG